MPYNPNSQPTVILTECNLIADRTQKPSIIVLCLSVKNELTNLIYVEVYYGVDFLNELVSF